MTESALIDRSQVILALADADCRRILDAIATADEPKTVSELVEQCSLSTATAYRKVDLLVDAGLLDESIRVNHDGRNATEYTLGMTSITITFTSGLEVACDNSPPERQKQAQSETRRVEPVRTSTDGGKRATDGDDRQHLVMLFEDVTGTRELVDEQTSSSQRIDEGDEAALAAYVTTIARKDGLSDTIAEPDMNHGED